jgi:hypothetical protein
LGTGLFLGVKRPGHGVDHLPPSSIEVKERVELKSRAIPLLPLWAFTACSRLNFYLCDANDSNMSIYQFSELGALGNVRFPFLVLAVTIFGKMDTNKISS